MKLHKTIFITLCISFSQFLHAGEVTVDGKPTGVDSRDAKEAFERLGDAMREAAERNPGRREVEVRAPDTRDLDRTPEPKETPKPKDYFDFDK